MNTVFLTQLPKVVRQLLLIGLVCAIAGAGALLTTLPGSHLPIARAAGRDPLAWPFASDSIWNMPIGSNAQYVAANIPRAANATVDPNWLITTSASDPVKPIYEPGSFGPGRCNGTTIEGSATTHVPDSLVVPDATSNPYSTPNNASAIVQPDGRSMVQLEPTARCSAGGNIYGYQACGWASTQDIEGDGLCGGHLGSGLSSIGGMLRLSELQASGDQTIPHALQLEIWDNYLFACNNTVKGFRWPASNADGGACDPNNGNHYKGTNSSLMQGSLLAIPTGATPDSLGITTDVGRKMFYALQNYGGYIVDDTGWDDVQVGVEHGVDSAYDFDGNTNIHNDVVTLFSALQVIDNNSSSNIGGGGTLRAPMAPSFSSTGGGGLNRSNWSVSGSPTGGGSTASQAIDGDISSRWTSGQAQSNGNTFQIDLGSQQSFSKIVLDSSNSPNDYPRGYIIFTSNDSGSWGNAVTACDFCNSSAVQTITFSTQNARYITILETQSSSWWWSIDELNIS